MGANPDADRAPDGVAGGVNHCFPRVKWTTVSIHVLMISRTLSLVECRLDFSLAFAVWDRVIFTVGGDMIAMVVNISQLYLCFFRARPDLKHALNRIHSAGNVIRLREP